MDSDVIGFLVLIFLLSWLSAELIEAWENKIWRLVALDLTTMIALVAGYAIYH